MPRTVYRCGCFSKVTRDTLFAGSPDGLLDGDLCSLDTLALDHLYILRAVADVAARWICLITTRHLASLALSSAMVDSPAFL